jgi:hypothetical protein
MTTLLAAVEPLPKPPFFAGLMDGQPWLISAILLLLGLGILVVFRNQGKPRQGSGIFLGLAALAIALQVAAALITTDRERLTAATQELVRATATAQTAVVEGFLASDVRLVTEGGRLGPLALPRTGWDKDEILSQIRRTIGGSYQLKEYAILRTQAEQRGPTAGRTQVRIRVVPEQYPAPTISWWRIEWRKEHGEWKAVLIQPLELGF